MRNALNRAERGERRINRSVARLALPALAGIGLIVVLIASGLLPPGPVSNDPTTRPSAAARASPAASVAPGSSLDPLATPDPPRRTPTPSAPPPTTAPPSGPPEKPVEVRMPFVPVVGFWSSDTSISTDTLRLALTGGGTRFGHVMVQAGDEAAIAGALGIELAPQVESGAPDQIRAEVSRGALAVMRASDVTPAVHALAIDGVQLFGNDRVARASDWPLSATVLAAPSAAWDQGAAWTLVAGGDIMLDRGVAHHTTVLGKGADYLFDGGTARVTRIQCCSFFGYEYPSVARTGDRGRVRELLRGADIAMANLETAILVDAPYHTGGFTFTGDARLLDGVAGAGIDFLSLANNHSRNGGARGLTTAMRELDDRGISHGGAGRDDVAAAQPTYLQVERGTVAILACDAIARGAWARPDRVGTQSCREGTLVDHIREARSQADVVIVFPHWGREYRAAPVAYQRRLAREWVAAGADLIVGAHSHFAGGMEDIDGRLVFYSLGNFIFDQDFRQATMMGVLPEMTFNGNRLVQVRLHPTLIVDAQPNLAPLDDDGAFVIDQMRRGSEGLLDY